MLNFDFYNPTHIVVGTDRLNELDALVPKDARVLITYGGGRDRVSLYRVYEAAVTILPLENSTHVSPVERMPQENDGKLLWWLAPY